MPEFLAVRCFQCGMCQVIQRNKKNKFKCKICHAAQSVIKVFSSSNRAKDVRQVVMELNTRIGEQTKIASAVSAVEDVRYEEEEEEEEEEEYDEVDTQRPSYWAKYLEEGELQAQQLEPAATETQPAVVEQTGDAVFALEAPEKPRRARRQQRARKRSTPEAEQSPVNVRRASGAGKRQRESVEESLAGHGHLYVAPQLEQQTAQKRARLVAPAAPPTAASTASAAAAAILSPSFAVRSKPASVDDVLQLLNSPEPCAVPPPSPAVSVSPAKPSPPPSASFSLGDAPPSPPNAEVSNLFKPMKANSQWAKYMD